MQTLVASAPARTHTVPARHRDRRPLLVLTLASVAITLRQARLPFDTDGWWHLRSGDVLIDRGFLGNRDPFSWTAGIRTWRHDSWAFDVLAATLRAVGGTVLVSIALFAASAAFAYAAYFLARRAAARPWPSVVAAVVAQWVMSAHIAERPQVVSYLLFAGVLVLADRAFRGSNTATAGLAALVALWANLHLTFSLGVGVVVVRALGRGIDLRQFRRPALVSGVVVVSGLCTPLGVSAYTAALDVREKSSMIEEWRRLDPATVRGFVVLTLILLTLAAMVRTGRWRRLEYLLPVCALSVLTIDGIRQEAFLALVMAPELALGLSSIPAKERRAHNELRARALSHGAILGLAIVSILPLTSSLGPGSFRGSPATSYPVRSTAAIPEGCRLLNEYTDGGYIIDHRWPEVLVSIDGRNDLYGAETVQEQESVLAGTPGALAWLDDHGVDCVLARPGRDLVRRLRNDGWHERARDPSGVLLVRGTGAPVAGR